MPIEFRNISYTYSKKTPFARKGLTNVSLTVNDGEWVAVMGPTGSGKSTLLQHLNGLLKPDLGEVLLDHVNIHSSSAALRETRQKVGLVFQYPEHQLFGSTVYEEIAYGPENYGYAASDVEQRVKTAMETVGLDYLKYKDRHPYELSGGEKRRIALAGVLATDPQIIALDEPTAGLDPSGRQKLVETITQLNRDYGKTVIWVTHEITEIAALVNRVLVIKDGQVVLDGAAREVLNNHLMTQLGLDVPVAVEISHHMRRKGKAVEGQPLTIEEIKKEIVRLVR